MPFIDLRTTVPAAPEQREALKAAFGQAITALHKTETYLMVSIQDNCELWLGGQKLEQGAYVAVSLYGSASSADYNRMTGLVCGILSQHLGLPPKAVYVTYHPVRRLTARKKRTQQNRSFIRKIRTGAVFVCSFQALLLLPSQALRASSSCASPLFAVGINALAKTGALLRVAVTQICFTHAVRLQIWTAAPALPRLLLPQAAPRLRCHSQLPVSTAGSGRCSCPRGESQVHAHG